MAKANTIDAVTAHAQTTVNQFARQHGLYTVETFTDRPDGKGMADNARMTLTAPVRALQTLARPHPKRPEPFLSRLHIMAANAYHADLLACGGSHNHELQEQVDRSGNPEGTQLYLIEAQNKLARINNRMASEHKAVISLIFRNYDMPINALWPEQYARRQARDLIKDALSWLMVEYGLGTC